MRLYEEYRFCRMKRLITSVVMTLLTLNLVSNEFYKTIVRKKNLQELLSIVPKLHFILKHVILFKVN